MWSTGEGNGKPLNITVIQVYALTSNTEDAEVERFHEDLQDLLELTPKKDVVFIISSVQSLNSVQLFVTQWISYFSIPVPYNEKDIFFEC